MKKSRNAGGVRYFHTSAGVDFLSLLIHRKAVQKASASGADKVGL